MERQVMSSGSRMCVTLRLSSVSKAFSSLMGDRAEGDQVSARKCTRREIHFARTGSEASCPRYRSRRRLKAGDNGPELRMPCRPSKKW